MFSVIISHGIKILLKKKKILNISCVTYFEYKYFKTDWQLNKF